MQHCRAEARALMLPVCCKSLLQASLEAVKSLQSSATARLPFFDAFRRGSVSLSYVLIASGLPFREGEFAFPPNALFGTGGLLSCLTLGVPKQLKQPVMIPPGGDGRCSYQGGIIRPLCASEAVAVTMLGNSPDATAESAAITCGIGQGFPKFMSFCVGGTCQLAARCKSGGQRAWEEPVLRAAPYIQITSPCGKDRQLM
mmetsp:Transcript_39209/g.111021  ORF Transcript_39209/g.111021 Transcript_39209/m.111021 type:complete len:200 (+) Transcript_39209:3446-4045(+)